MLNPIRAYYSTYRYGVVPNHPDKNYSGFRRISVGLITDAPCHKKIILERFQIRNSIKPLYYEKHL